MFRNTADVKSDVERFIRRIIEFDIVWYLSSDLSIAMCESNAEMEDEDEAPAAVLLFFSDLAYAKRAKAENFPAHDPESMSLFNFMYRWLPGMSGDGVLAGPNWTGDLMGLEIDPFELREAIEAAMTPKHLERHESMYQELSDPRDEA
ncbi:MAG: DUF2750 domain-containing protein [Acinetobacter sp.]